MRRPAYLALIALILASAALFIWKSPSRQPRAPLTTPSPTPGQKKAATVTLFFANRAYVETGDESLPRLIPEPRVLQADETSLAEAAVRALQTGPRSPKAAPVIRHDIHIIGVRTARGIAEVNLARANLSGGSLEELLLIQGVVRSLTGLPGIGAVRFLVDGQPTDTLMGHLSVNTPLTEKDLR